MELSNRAVVAAICLFCGLVVGILFLPSVMRRVESQSSTTTNASAGGIARDRLSSSSSNAIALRTLELTSARRRAAELEKQLHEQTGALSDARRELENLTGENEKLRNQRNQSLDLLLVLLSDEPAGESAAPMNLISSEEEAEVAANAQQFDELLELDNLRNELELVRGELAEANAARQVERAEADQLRQQMEQSAAELLAKIGPDAVTVLSDALEHPDAEVRRLAARALRSFGESGQGAIAALTMALADPDLRVREEAAMALRAIRD